MTSKCLKNFDYSEGAFPKTCWAGGLMRNWGVPQKKLEVKYGTKLSAVYAK